MAQASDQIGAFVALLIGVGSLAGLIYKAVAWSREKLENWKRRRSILGLVIKPTAEEIAKFSVKCRQHTDPEEKKFHIALRNHLRTMKEREFGRSQGRLAVVAIFVIVYFSAIALRYLWITVH